jgi:uncharacterized phage protein (TIGR02220 family)
MIILKKDIKNLLSKNLSVEQRGLMITALLCIEKIPAFTEAKFKIFVDYKKFSDDLIYLHEQGFINWDKYKYYKGKQAKQKEDPKIIEIIAFMNQLYGRSFDSEKEGTVSNLRPLLKEYSIDDIKLVVANRYEEWKDETKMQNHLNPSTVFRKKLFEKYLEIANRTQKGSGITKAILIGLKEGDSINGSNVSDFSDNDLYSFKTYLTDSNGDKKGNGKADTKIGSDLKKMVNVQENLIKMTGFPINIFIFVKR